MHEEIRGTQHQSGGSSLDSDSRLRSHCLERATKLICIFPSRLIHHNLLNHISIIIFSQINVVVNLVNTVNLTGQTAEL